MDKRTPLNRSAREVKHHRVMMRILPIVLAILATAAVCVYVVSALYNKYGSFTVTVNKFDMLNYGLTLSETPDFTHQISRLNARAAEEITNISENDLPADLDNINGSHNGEDFMAYTFYCSNAGEQTVTYEYEMIITNVTNNLDRAVRVRLYVNGVATDYARTATDGSGAEPGTTEFVSANTVVRQQVSGFTPGDNTKFTIVIWIEGDDPDCKNDVMDGTFKIDMKMSVLRADETGK